MGRLTKNNAPHRRLSLARFIPLIVVCAIFVALPFVVPPYLQNMLTRVLIYAIFAMSLNLIWGYTGLMSLGHAAYFGIGSYVCSIMAIKFGINNFWLVIGLSIIATAAVAAIFGAIALRVSGLYFLLVTLALGQLIYYVALSWRPVTGGNSGIFGVPFPNLGFPIEWNTTYFYLLVLVVLAISAYIMYRIIQSPFGQALKGIRENKRRMRALGYNTWLYSYIVFIIAGVFAGIAGVLFSYYLKGTTIEQSGLTLSTVALLIVIIGSTRVFWGPMLGAIIVVLMEYFASIYLPARWPMILGAVFVISVIFVRGGVGLYLEKLWNKLRAYRAMEADSTIKD